MSAHPFRRGFKSVGKALPREAVEHAWHEWQSSRSREACDTLAQRYIHLVRYMARRLSRALPPVIEVDDLVSAGAVGFVSALQAFDPTHGVDFPVYALTRIRGAMVDFIREIDPVGRVTRRRLRALEQALSSLQQELARPPSSQETARRLGISMDAYHQLMIQATAAMTLSLERIERDGDDEGHRGTRPRVADTATKDPLTSLLDKESGHRVAAMVAQLSPARQLVLHLRYVEELNFREIAMAMDISESRATQHHSAAILALRASAADSRPSPDGEEAL